MAFPGTGSEDPVPLLPLTPDLSEVEGEAVGRFGSWNCVFWLNDFLSPWQHVCCLQRCGKKTTTTHFTYKPEAGGKMIATKTPRLHHQIAVSLEFAMFFRRECLKASRVSVGLGLKYLQNLDKPPTRTFPGCLSSFISHKFT